MATLFTCSFPSIKNVTWTINVDDRDHAGAATTVDCAADGFTLTYDGAEDILTPVIGSRLEFTMAVDSTTESAIQSFATALISSDEERYTIEIQRDSGSGDSLYWVGYVLPDLSGFEDLETPYGFKVSAVDGLSRLKSVEYNDGASPPEPYGVETFTTHILNCLTQGTLHTAYYGATDHFLKTSVNWVDSTIGAPTATKCPLAYSRVNGEIFAERNNSNDTIEWNFKSCYEVLEIIMRNWQCRLLYSEGAYRVEQVAERAQDNFYERRFSYDGTLRSSANNAAADVTIQQTTVNEKLAGNIFNYLPALSKVTATWEHKTIKNQLAGTGGKWIGGSVQTTTAVISNIETDANTRLFIRGAVGFNISLGATYAGVPWRYVVKMRVYKDGFYINSQTFSVQNGQGDYMQQVGRDPDPPEWISSTAAYEISSAFSTTDTINHIEVLDLELDNVPTGGNDLTVVFTLDGAYELDETPILSAVVNTWFVKSPQLYIVDSTDEDSYLEQIRVYEADNPSTGNSDSIDFDMAFGGAVQGWTLSKLQTSSNGSTWSDSGATWDRDTNTDNLAFGQLWVQQAMALRKVPTKTYTGQFLTKSLMPHSRAAFDFDSSAWLMLRGTFSAREHIFQGVWVAAGIDETGITPGPPIKKGAQTPQVVQDPEFVGLPGSFDPTVRGLGVRTADVAMVAITANFVGAAGVSAGTVTSIPCREAIAGGAFIEDDNIFVVNQTTGQVYAFTISTTSLNNDTALAVDSKVISEDIPGGAVILYSVMNKHTTTGGVLPNPQNGYIMRAAGNKWDAYGGTNDGYPLVWDTTNGWQEEQLNTAGIAAGAVTNAKAANMPANSLKGNATIASVDPQDLQSGDITTDGSPASGKYVVGFDASGNLRKFDIGNWPSGGVSGTGVANRLAIWSGTSTLTSDDFPLYFNTTTNKLGVGTASPAAYVHIGVPTGTNDEGLRVLGNLSGNLNNTISNANNVSGGANTIVNISVGGSSAGDPMHQYSVSGATTWSAGVDNSDSDKFKIKNTSTPSTTSDKGLVITTTDRVGINTDSPLYDLDVSGNVRGAVFYNTSTPATTAFGAGAGTSPTLNSVLGGRNCVYISFTTGTSPATNANIIQVIPSASFPAGMIPVIGQNNASAATDISKFYIGSWNNSSFWITANGTLSASTTYSLNIWIGGY